MSGAHDIDTPAPGVTLLAEADGSFERAERERCIADGSIVPAANGDPLDRKLGRLGVKVLTIDALGRESAERSIARRHGDEDEIERQGRFAAHAAYLEARRKKFGGR